MKNIVLIITAIILIGLLIFVRIEFNKGIDKFKTEISKNEKENKNSFLIAKEKKLQKLLLENQSLGILVKKKFSDSDAITKKDTFFRFFYLKEDVPINYYKLSYYDYIVQVCSVEIKQEQINKKIEYEKKLLLEKFGEDFSYWFDTLKNSKLLSKKEILFENKDFPQKIYITDIDYNNWAEFKKFLYTYQEQKKDIRISNLQEKTKYNQLFYSTKYQLNTNATQYFLDDLKRKKSLLFDSTVIEKQYQSNLLGTLSYTFLKKTFNKPVFDVIADDAFVEQWRTNSLYTGAMPYSYCYGSSNYCNDWGCSEIYVYNGGLDVVVIIKNSSDEVVRHAYIKSGDSFTFNVYNGTYNVYFYSGTGWNPKKFITDSPCSIYGGFVSNENTGKDSYASVSNQRLSYSLTRVVNGNFSMESSSKGEAFK